VFGEVAQHVSEYNNKVDDFVTSFNVCDESVSAHAVARHCKSDENVYETKPNRYDLMNVYDFLFRIYDISFPDFETEMLTGMNIAPSQLHP